MTDTTSACIEFRWDTDPEIPDTLALWASLEGSDMETSIIALAPMMAELPLHLRDEFCQRIGDAILADEHIMAIIGNALLEEATRESNPHN